MKDVIKKNLQCTYSRLTYEPKLLINELQSNCLSDVLKLIPSHRRPTTFRVMPIVHKLLNLVVHTCHSSITNNSIIEAKRHNINPPG